MPKTKSAPKKFAKRIVSGNAFSRRRDPTHNIHGGWNQGGGKRSKPDFGKIKSEVEIELDAED